MEPGEEVVVVAEVVVFVEGVVEVVLLEVVDRVVVPGEGRDHREQFV